MVSRKNPQNNFYSGSESTCGRVAAAVCEKNIGTEYVAQVSLCMYRHLLILLVRIVKQLLQGVKL
jgi:hypothetical protein